MLTILADDFTRFPFRDALLCLTEERKPSVLLVPEQLALSTEQEAATILPPHAPLCFEVSNFTRLADRAFRSAGGISYRYADRAAEALLMWKALDAAAPFLAGKKTKGATDTVHEKLSAMNELWAAGLTPADLRRAASMTGNNEALKEKLSDLSLIMELYEGEMREIYGSHAEDLDKLLSLLKERPLFKEIEFFVSGFTSFTAKELLILIELARHTSVTVALPLPEENERALCYEETLETKRALLSAAARADCKVAFGHTEKAHRPAALSYAKGQLFRTDGDKTPFSGGADGLILASLHDPHDACRRIASIIAEEVRGGARYRDFAVFAREPEKYDGILDAALASEGIPYFFAVPTTLPELSLSKMILAAYACIGRGFRRTDLVAYMKSGFSGISKSDTDIFELYISFWRLHGQAFSQDKPFDMHPRGYVTHLSDADEARLALVNRVRKDLLSPLWALQKATRSSTTAREHATALYEFLRALKTEERLLEMAERERRADRVAQSDRLSRLSGVLCDLLDRICEITGELPLTADRFAELLSLLFSSVSLGTLPTSQDTVTVANADAVRPTGASTVFLLGVNEGEFPATVSLSQGAFEEEERRTLSSLGFTVGKDPSVRASREQLSFLRALVSPEKKAVVIAFENSALGTAVRPSKVFGRLCKLFPESVTTYTRPPEIYSLRAATEQFFEHRGTPRGEALSTLLQETPLFSRYTELASVPVFDPFCRIEDTLSAALFPERLYTSQTKLDKYLDCPFAYYCRYVLRIPENERAGIRSLEIGTTVHAILERLFELFAENGETIRSVAEEKIAGYIERACTEYLKKSCPPSMQGSPRIAHIFSRLRRAATLVAEDIYNEFAHSEFTPRFCELSLGEYNTPEALVLKDETGKSVCIGGKIDRVDIYRSPEGEVFVRVVDYKTGSRSFSREDLRRGRNMQMFLYLCAIWKSENEAFLSRLSLSKGASPLPAGIVYSESNPAFPTRKAPLPADNEKAEVFDQFKRKGFFLREEAVLRAMDDTFSGRYFPAKRKANGEISYPPGAFGTLVEFGEMLDETEAAVCDIAKRMRAGIADIIPDEQKKTSPCKGCAFLPICRKES